MSIAEFPSSPGISGPVLDAGADWAPPYDGGERAGRGGGDRTPPQDNNAEQSVLGSMLLSKDAIADVIESVRGTDFYRPAHETIFDAVVDLYGRGEPADPVTVSAELQRRGELARIGGAPYLHTLSASVPIAANAGYYAEIVREKAILRRLVDAGTRIAQMGYTGEGQVDEVVDRAQAEVYGVTDKRTAEDYAPLSDIMEAALDEIEAISSRDGGLVGVPTGFADLDELTNGLHGGQMVIVAARPAVGKALALDTPLPTPTGWTTMGDVQVGDQLFGADGLPTTVVAATEVMVGRPCYEVVFSDGSVVTADAHHQWLTSAADADSRVFTTEQIAATVEMRHSVTNTVALKGRLSEHLQRAQLMDACDRRGEVKREDGSITLTFPTVAQAECVHELIVGLGYTCTRVSPTVLNFVTADDVFGSYEMGLLHKELRPTSAARVNQRVITEVRSIATVPVRCVEVDNADHLYLAGESMIPTHNSTLGLDICRAASIHNNQASVIFSLEMTRNEITMRLLSAEAKIPLNHMRNGHMNDEDWAKLARKMGEVSSAPFFIDDSPNMTMMEIRAKARRLKQRHDLRLIVIDYLQLMTSGKKVESRQIEVSEFSRQIKLLAKELDVPIVALSQLNRGPEQRSDKRPMMSDLRESGCVTADTRVMRADTNAEITIGELMESGAKDVPVWALDDRLKLVPRTMTHAFPSGTKPVYELTLASGRKVKATANHPFLTFDGWKPLGELAPGDRVGSIRHVPPPLEISPRDPDEIALLAHLIGDGSFVKRQPIRYASIDEANLATVSACAWHRFGITAIRDEYPAARVTTLRLPAPYPLTHGKRNPIAAWLDEMGLFGLRSHEKFVPEWVFGLPKDQVALFLRNLWATDGCVHWDRHGGLGRIYYASTSRRLVDDVARLLLRFNVFSRVKRTKKGGYRDCYQLHIYGCENQLRFLEDIGVHGARSEKVDEVVERLLQIRPSTNLDTVPKDVWDRVREALAEKGMTQREFTAAMGSSYGGSSMWKTSPSRARLGRVATILGDADLEVMATNDVFWDAVKSIEHIGEEPVYDATVMGLHNFVAEGIPTHNSIEQDADMVILLHREDVYEKESTRPGEADLIVAKHRNGPTRDVTVAFQGHYSRFVDMAQG